MHCIEYCIFKLDTSKEEITQQVLEMVDESGDRYGTESVKFPTDKIFECHEDARAYIEMIDTSYGGFAVKFYDYGYNNPSKRVTELLEKAKEQENKLVAYVKAHSIKNHKAAYIGCPCCGSKLNKDKLISDICPLCYIDLRAGGTLERIDKMEKKVDELKWKAELERHKDKSNATVKWLVKWEYHC